MDPVGRGERTVFLCHRVREIANIHQTDIPAVALMKILMIGGTGFISSRLVDALVRRGHVVTVVSRGKTRPAVDYGNTVRYLVADRREPAELESAVGGQTFDAAYDMIAYQPGETSQAIRILRGKVGRFIHCSTVSVYMVSDHIRCPVTEDQDNLPVMKFFDRNPFGMQYGMDKRECENRLWESHHVRDFPVTALRPTYVSGPGDPMRRDFFWIERILDGGTLLIPGSGDIAFQQVYVEDVAGAFASVLDSEASKGGAYNVVGAEARSLNEYLDDLCEMLGSWPDRMHVDQAAFDRLPFSTSPGEHVFPFNTLRTAVFSLRKSEADLKYRPTEFREWMARTIDWYRKHYRGHSAGYSARQEEIRFARLWKQESRRLADGVLGHTEFYAPESLSKEGEADG